MGKTILTVDDSRTIRALMGAALSQAGYRVMQAGDGVDGLALLADETPDVIVTDINMPRLDGYGFIAGVRRNARCRAVPILVVTTESEAAMRERARSAGATGWIVKPFDPGQFVAAIRHAAV